MMNILQKTEDFVFQLLKDKLSISYSYHNFNHTQRVVTAAKTLIQNEKISPDEAEIILIATWFQDTGYIKTIQNHEEESIIIARDFLLKNDKSEEYIEKISNLIQFTEVNQS